MTAYAKKKEGDHIADYTNWAVNQGKDIALAREARYKGLTFASLEECERLTSSGLDNGLRGAIPTPARDTWMRYDQPGGPHNH
jgi:hypothetical protein